MGMRPVDFRGSANVYAQGIKEQLFTPETPERIELLMAAMAPGSSSGAEFYTHPGGESGLVAVGAMKHFVRNKTFLLREGDTFKFQSTIPHRFENPGPSEAHILWALVAPIYL